MEPWEAYANLGWPEATKAERIANLTAQLPREVGPRHVLRGEAASPVAVRWDTNDTLFALSGGRVAEVHLTWRQEEEPDPRWPRARVFPSLEDWARERMAEHHAEWRAVNS